MRRIYATGTGDTRDAAARAAKAELRKKAGNKKLREGGVMTRQIGQRRTRRSIEKVYKASTSGLIED